MKDEKKIALKMAGMKMGVHIQNALKQIFGAKKVCYVLILADAGRGGGMTFTSDMTTESAIPILRELSERIAHGSEITTIH